MEQNNQSEQQGYTCSGDCLRCSGVQRQYCASQFTYRNMRMLESLMTSLQSLAEDVKNISEKLNAIQNAESELFDPTSVDEEEKSKSSTANKKSAQ